MTGLRWCSNASNCLMDIQYVLKNLWGYFRRSGYVLKYSPFVCTSSLNGCIQYSLLTEFSASYKHTAKTRLWYSENRGRTNLFRIGGIILIFNRKQTTFWKGKTHRNNSWIERNPLQLQTIPLEKWVQYPFDLLLLAITLPLSLGLNDTAINQ